VFPNSRYCLIVCNALGLAVDNRFIDLEPKHVALNSSHAIAASNDIIYIWEYRYVHIDVCLQYLTFSDF